MYLGLRKTNIISDIYSVRNTSRTSFIYDGIESLFKKLTLTFFIDDYPTQLHDEIVIILKQKHRIINNRNKAVKKKLCNFDTNKCTAIFKIRFR